MDHFVKTQIVLRGAVHLVGFQGERMDDERRVFDQLKLRFSEIEKGNQYLVILPGMRPLAAVERTELQDIPEGMVTFTLAEGEYVQFRFEKKDVGEFWSKVCTEQNQAKYGIDLSKPRYEVFTPDRQPGTVEWYFPSKRTSRA